MRISASPTPDLSGTYLGTVYSMVDCGDTDTYPYLWAVRTAERVGRASGYSSLDAAKAAAAEVSKEWEPAVAVIEGDHRFYLQHLLASELNGAGENQPLRFEYQYEMDPFGDDGGSFTSTKHLTSNNVVAVIDGESSL